MSPIYRPPLPDVHRAVVVDQLELAREGLLACADSLVDVGGDCIADSQKAESYQPPHFDLFSSKLLAGGQNLLQASDWWSNVTF